MRRFGVIVGGMAFVAMLSWAAAPAGAATATGCSGTAKSYDAHGAVVDSVAFPGPGATQDDPFLVARDGTVSWAGSTASVIQHGSWKVDAWPVTISGSMENASAKTSSSGTEKVKDRLPISVTGLIYVKATLSGAGGARCVGGGWVKFTGSPLSTPLFWIAAFLLLFGFLGFLMLMLGFRSGLGATELESAMVARTIEDGVEDYSAELEGHTPAGGAR